MQRHWYYTAFTPDTFSSYTSRIQLYPFVSLVAVYMFPVSATKLSLTQHYGDKCPLGMCINPDTSCSSAILVSGHMYLVSTWLYFVYIEIQIYIEIHRPISDMFIENE